VFLWSVPRTVSTSFERMMSARGDHTVFDEPFSRHYYYGPDRHSRRYSETLPDSSPQVLLSQIHEAARERPVFVKDMAYQARDILSAEVLAGFRNSFLVRDPAATIPSLADKWPDFTDDETGWDALAQAADVVESLGQPLVVVDANRMCRDPRGVVSAWCDAMGIAFVERALSWDPGMRPEWDLWEEWHETTAESTGFEPLDDPPPPPTEAEGRVFEAYRRAVPVYERLLARALG
jgi:hypothetical protein